MTTRHGRSSRSFSARAALFFSSAVLAWSRCSPVTSPKTYVLRWGPPNAATRLIPCASQPRAPGAFGFVTAPQDSGGHFPEIEDVAAILPVALPVLLADRAEPASNPLVLQERMRFRITLGDQRRDDGDAVDMTARFRQFDSPDKELCVCVTHSLAAPQVGAKRCRQRVVPRILLKIDVVAFLSGTFLQVAH
jgi:hypothetical protein